MNTPRNLLLASLAIGIMLAQSPGEDFPFGSKSAESNERNLITNGNFEKGTEGWEFVNWGKNDKMEIDMAELHEGKPTLRVENPEPGHCYVRQIVMGKPQTHYRLTAYIKTKNVEPAKKGAKPGAAPKAGSAQKAGAVLEVGRTGIYTPPMQRTEDWKKVSVDFTTKETGEIRVGPSLGNDAGFASGTAWFSELTLVELGGNAQK
jgi:hypothetical protein